MQFSDVNKNNKTFRRDCYKGRGCRCGLCTVAFFKWSLQADGLQHWYWQWQWDFLLTLKREIKLTLVQINRRWRTWSKEDDTFPLLESSQNKLSLSLSSVYFGCWLKIIFCRLHGIFFVIELKIVSAADHYRALSCSVSRESKIISARVSVADRFAPSNRSCFVALPVFTTSSIVTSPWSPCF